MSEEKLLFGAAHAVINPVKPMSLAGYFNIRMYTEIFDDLEVRALVLKKGDIHFLLVQFDLLGVPELVYRTAREAIADLKQFDDTNVIITATHTHTAPDCRITAENADSYLKLLAEKTSEVVRKALANLQECELAYGMTEDNRFEFNRRYWMENGNVLTNPGKLNPDIKRPEGAVDYEIPLVAIKQGGDIKVLLANIVNHTDTVGGTEVSADWAGFTRRELEKKMGADSIMFPLIGCAGNINHFDVSTDMNQTSYDEARRIGTGYAQTISKALKDLKPAKNTDVEILYTSLEIGPTFISKSTLEEANAVLEKYKDLPDPRKENVTVTSEDLARKSPIALKLFASILTAAAEDRDMRRFRLSGIAIGPIVIASLPGEPFVEIGLEIRKDIFKDKLCMVISHCNGTGLEKIGEGYIPNRWNYGRGGYETEPGSNPFERDTAVKLADAWRNAAKKLN